MKESLNGCFLLGGKDRILMVPCEHTVALSSRCCDCAGRGARQVSHGHKGQPHLP
jgi:hypothetical protein